MAQSGSQNTFVSRFLPTLLLLVVSPVLAAAERVSPATFGPGLAEFGNPPLEQWESWLTFQIKLRSLERLLSASDNGPMPGEADEASSVAMAQSQAGRFSDSGIARDLTEEEIAQGLADIAGVGATILSNPSHFTDPFWGEYLKTLDAMAGALGSSGLVSPWEPGVACAGRADA